MGQIDEATTLDMLVQEIERTEDRLAEAVEALAYKKAHLKEELTEVAEEKAEKVAGIVKETMENIYPLAVPLAVDTHWGRSWYDAKE